MVRTVGEEEAWRVANMKDRVAMLAVAAVRSRLDLTSAAAAALAAVAGVPRPPPLLPLPPPLPATMAKGSNASLPRCPVSRGEVWPTRGLGLMVCFLQGA